MNTAYEPDYPEIRISNQEQEFSSWLSEKSGNLLRELSRMVDCIQNIRAGKINESYSYDEQLDDCLNSALVDAVKLVSIIDGCNEVYDLGDAGLIYTKGYEGYLQLMEKYGMPVEASCQTIKEDDDKLREQIVELLSGDRINRTLIHICLRRIKQKSEKDLQMENDIEKVSMNEQTWEWFTNKYYT